MFRLYTKRVFKSPLFWACVAAASFFWISGAFAQYGFADQGLNILYVMRVSQAFGMIVVLVPVLVTIPFIFFWVEELQNKSVYYQMIRTNYRKYYRSQIFGALYSSGIVAIISVAIFSIVSFGAGAGFLPAECNFYDGTGVEAIFYSQNMWFLFVWQCIVFILFCLPWTMFSLVFSLFTQNRYVLIAAPFVCFFSMNYLLDALYPLYPNVVWFLPTQTLLEGKLLYEDFWSLKFHILYPVIYHFVLIGVLATIYYVVSKRRFQREGI